MGKFTENRDKTLNQAAFIRRLAGSMGCSYMEAERWLKAVKRELTACLMNGNAVKLVELGTFEPRFRVPRRNPHNGLFGGAETLIKACISAHLTPSKHLNKRLTEAYEKRQGEKNNGQK